MRLRIVGRVQGVWYRASTQEVARRLGLHGFVQNQADGSVLVEAQGPADGLVALHTWCQSGPELAVVKAVTREELPLSHTQTVGFEIRR